MGARRLSVETLTPAGLLRNGLCGCRHNRKVPVTRTGVTSWPLIVELAERLDSSSICWACCSCRLLRTLLRNCSSFSCCNSACSKSRPLMPPLNCTPVALPSGRTTHDARTPFKSAVYMPAGAGTDGARELVGDAVHGQIADHVLAVELGLEGVLEAGGDVDLPVLLIAEEPGLVVGAVAGVRGDLGAVDGDADDHRLAVGRLDIGDVLRRLRERCCGSGGGGGGSCGGLRGLRRFFRAARASGQGAKGEERDDTQ